MVCGVFQDHRHTSQRSQREAILLIHKRQVVVDFSTESREPQQVLQYRGEG
jgi:hypothetical protein